MQPNAHTNVQPVDGNRTIGDRIRDMLAYIVSPGRRRALTCAEFAQLVSNSVCKYHVGVVKLIKAVAAMFGGSEKRTRTGVDLESGLGGGEVANVASANSQVGESSAGVGDRVTGSSSCAESEDDILKGLKRVSAAFGDLDLSLDMEELTGASSDGHESMSSTEDPEEDVVIDFIDGYFKDIGHELEAHTRDRPTRVENSTETAHRPPRTNCNRVIVRDLAHRTPEPTVAQANIGYMRSCKRRYAGQLTLTVPDKHPSGSRRLPSEAARAFRELRYEHEALTSTSLQYNACELADRRVFLQHPIEDPQTDGDYISESRLNRETYVGPLKRQWIWRGKARGAPIIKITKPEDVDSAMSQGSNQDGIDSYKPNGLEVPSMPVKRTRGRSNAIWVPPSSGPLPSYPVAGTPTQPSSPVDPVPTTPVSNDVPPMATAAQLARKMKGRPSSMSEWLGLFSAGSNPFVDENMVATAGAMIESAMISPPLSPAFSSVSLTLSESSPESSPPCTPPVEPKSLPSVEVAQEPTQLNFRRARCSYDGAQHEPVVAPVIPDELLTDEIGVAC